MEQSSNALALSQLGYGSMTEQLTKDTIGDWLPLPRPRPVRFLVVATELCAWLLEGRRDLPALSQYLCSHIVHALRLCPKQFITYPLMRCRTSSCLGATDS